jgi:hypothetical protein
MADELVDGWHLFLLDLFEELKGEGGNGKRARAQEFF